MNVQVFTIRLVSEYFLSDQKKLNDFLETVDFVKSATHFIESESYWSVLLHYEKKNEVKTAAVTAVTIEESDLSPGNLYVLECLKQWRTDKAESMNVPKFMVCHNSELINIAFHHPKDVEGLKKIKGFGAKKAEKYGEDIIAVLNAV